MNIRKRIFSVLMCLMLLLTSLPSVLIYAASDDGTEQENLFHLKIENGQDTLVYTVESVNDQPVSGSQYTVTGPGTIRNIAKAGDTFTLRIQSDQYNVSFHGYNNFGLEIEALGVNYYKFTISDTFNWQTTVLSTYVSCKEYKTVSIEECENGSITTDADTPFQGGTVTVFIHPEEGYRVVNVKYSTDGGENWRIVNNLNVVV